MFLLIVLLVFLFLFLTSGSSSTVEKKVCSPHKWVYKKQPDTKEIEYLQCENCDMFPGGNTEE